MKIDAERLRGFLDCMHDEADERDKRSAQISAIVKAAKEAGYDTKAVRKVFVRERMDDGERRKQDDLLETYEGALGGKGRALRAIEAGVPVGEACAANGVHRATVARARHGDSHVANETSNATPHDPETGEMGEVEVGIPTSEEGGCGPDSKPADDSCIAEDGHPVLRESVGPPCQSLRSIAACPSTPPQRADDSTPQPPQEVGAGDPRGKANTSPDDLAIPSFLRRVTAHA